MVKHRSWQVGLARFNGKHNSSKARVFVTLLMWQHKHTGPGLSAKQLADITGASYGYLNRKLPLLCEWGYLRRRGVAHGSRVFYTYKLATRGRRFVSYRMNDALRKHYWGEVIRRNQYDPWAKIKSK